MEELQTLRRLGAFVCHQYGALTEFYDRMDIKHHDLMVSENAFKPPHVLNAIEAWSECYVRTLTRRRKRRSQKKGVAA
ncbi:hypothetical protein CAG63_18405 [Vibrio sp. V37_P2S8PM304]|uniref:hypothetical protein n=1 Tax=Vibrio sp. V37_P2S8PM304 TaxID=1938688 RepID=UPI001372B2E3|nr:hypothetical protein [Vibrio sp. V37_P2S8PM304]NAX32020.1 hypothetical protein [Vibrio sp. V37_P2S8PM304]